MGFYPIGVGASTINGIGFGGTGYIVKSGSASIAIIITTPSVNKTYVNSYNGTWGGWEIYVRSSDLGIVIKNSGNVAAIFDDEVQIATITLPANHKYLVLAHTRSTQGFEAVGAKMSCNIKKISGTINSTVGMGTTRTLMDYGGGCTAWGIVDTATSCVYGLFGYGYYSAQYNYAGEICAIQLS